MESHAGASFFHIFFSESILSVSTVMRFCGSLTTVLFVDAGVIIKRKSGEIPCPLAVEAFAAHLSYICRYDDKYSKWVSSDSLWKQIPYLYWGSFIQPHSVAKVPCTSKKAERHLLGISDTVDQHVGDLCRNWRWPNSFDLNPPPLSHIIHYPFKIPNTGAPVWLSI